MTVREYLSRVSSEELTEQMAYDLLETAPAPAPPAPPGARLTMPYAELEARLDAWWPPEP